jgi:hypothetical protein
MERMGAVWGTVSCNFRNLDKAEVLERFADCFSLYRNRVEKTTSTTFRQWWEVYAQLDFPHRKHDERGLVLAAGFIEMGRLSLLQTPEYMRYCAFLHCSRGFYKNKSRTNKFCWREQMTKTAYVWQNHGAGKVVLFQNLHVFHRHWGYNKTADVSDLQSDPLILSYHEAEGEANLSRRLRQQVEKIWGPENVYTGNTTEAADDRRLRLEAEELKRYDEYITKVQREQQHHKRAARRHRSGTV